MSHSTSANYLKSNWHILLWSLFAPATVTLTLFNSYFAWLLVLPVAYATRLLFKSMEEGNGWMRLVIIAICFLFPPAAIFIGVVMALAIISEHRFGFFLGLPIYLFPITVVLLRGDLFNVLEKLSCFKFNFAGCFLRSAGVLPCGYTHHEGTWLFFSNGDSCRLCLSISTAHDLRRIRRSNGDGRCVCRWC